MVDSRQKRTTRRENPSADQQREEEARSTGNPQSNAGRTTPGRLNEMAAGGMASLLMTQPVRWGGRGGRIPAGEPQRVREARPLADQESEDGTKALQSFHFFSL